MSKYCVGDFIIAPGRCLGTISSVHKKEVTILWKDNGLSAKYTFSQIKGFNYQHISKDSQFKIGKRCEIAVHKKYSGERGYLSHIPHLKLSQRENTERKNPSENKNQHI
ncbi:MAG: hypothetical protein V7L29_00920 [Nostoc sp.]|uniref:hypothetical protein n=1 Tax=Nostoc sp. TaxID=1180 RepID=UPI002FF53FBE